MRKRLDSYLCEKRVFSTRSAARQAVMEGKVSVDGRVVSKAGFLLSGDERVEAKEDGLEYVSRGGKKLERALDEFGLDVRGEKVLDVGSSTGGFTDCFLQRGAEMVIALDVGKGLLDWKLRNDPRVIVKEGINARYLEPPDLPFTPLVAAIDVSFISLKKVLEPVFRAIEERGKVVALVKPQFEAGRNMVEKGGVVRSEETHLAVLSELIEWTSSRSLRTGGITYSPLKGPKGNIEFFLLLTREKETLVDVPLVERTVREAHCFHHRQGV